VIFLFAVYIICCIYDLLLLNCLPPSFLFVKTAARAIPTANNRTFTFRIGVSHILHLPQSLAALDKFTALFASAKAVALTETFNASEPPLKHSSHNSPTLQLSEQNKASAQSRSSSPRHASVSIAPLPRSPQVNARTKCLCSLPCGLRWWSCDTVQFAITLASLSSCSPFSSTTAAEASSPNRRLRRPRSAPHSPPFNSSHRPLSFLHRSLAVHRAKQHVRNLLKGSCRVLKYSRNSNITIIITTTTRSSSSSSSSSSTVPVYSSTADRGTFPTPLQTHHRRRTPPC
jgi:hypothetical protein